MSAAQIMGMVGVSAFAALLRTFTDEWALSNTEAGWISGAFFVGYMIAVPVLASLTDRIDTRRVYLAFTAFAGVIAVAYALLAEGFWSALVIRALSGVALAGTYMPGLKLLTDFVHGPQRTRAFAIYTSCFSVGIALSYVITGETAAALGWRWAFGVAAVGSVVAYALVLAVAPPDPPDGTHPQESLLDFRPVFRNREAMGYIIAYGAHMWELYGQRSWIVAFLIFALSLQADTPSVIVSAAVIASAVNLAGVAGNLVCNEFAMRIGRVRTATVVALVSIALSATIGFTASWPYGIVVALCMVYGITTYGDSAAVIGGAVIAAKPGQAGMTMAVLSFFGFAGAGLGALVFGVVLDLAGGSASGLAWGLAFASLGAAALIGPLALRLLNR
jgi:predicted MFS family arabinose efflux permease